MLYLGNNHIGFDAQSLGFPSIKGCQAIIYQTQQGIFGFHDMRTGSTPVLTYDQVVTLKIAEFSTWVQGYSMNHATQALGLYGVINQKHQYGKDEDGKGKWRGMLFAVAGALNYRGPVYGARITDHVGPDDSVYVRCDTNGTACTIRYKRWSKMDFDRANTLALDSTVQQVIAKNSPGSFDVRDPVEDLYEVRRKGAGPGTVLVDEGDLNTLSPSKLKQFR